MRDRQGANPALDALADNGGATLTHAPRYGSFAIDGGVGPCPETDARGVARPQNGRCDIGAFEWAGPPPPADDEPPDTQYVGGPVQDSLETMAFFFTGTDNLTPTDELIYECRLIEHDLTEAPEPQSPFEALDPMLHLPVVLERLADRAARGGPLHVRGARDRPRRPRGPDARAVHLQRARTPTRRTR